MFSGFAFYTLYMSIEYEISVESLIVNILYKWNLNETSSQSNSEKRQKMQVSQQFANHNL